MIVMIYELYHIWMLLIKNIQKYTDIKKLLLTPKIRFWSIAPVNVSVAAVLHLLTLNQAVCSFNCQSYRVTILKADPRDPIS